MFYKKKIIRNSREIENLEYFKNEISRGLQIKKTFDVSWDGNSRFKEPKLRKQERETITFPILPNKYFVPKKSPLEAASKFQICHRCLSKTNASHTHTHWQKRNTIQKTP